ncbi:MAG: hypothetical protein KC613_22185, partial [Myxococcales bacterium]|nr:hypothetical protein [Myxococcales bacterium]
RIADLSAYAEGSELMRVGQGSLGGKGRGVAFLHALLARSEWTKDFDGIEIDVPRTVVIGTGEFGRFLAEHPPPGALLDSGKDEAILQWFLAHPLPEDLCRSLRSVLPSLDGPLAVRSSSLLEDSRFQPFAGVYDTWMLANNDADLEERLDQLCRAIRAVWASTWFNASRAYFRSAPQSVEEERMGIVIQQVVGRRHGVRFYPDMAGVGQSRNFYPLPGQAPEDGVVLMAVGLGHSVVSGGPVFRFSPRHPKNTQTWLTAHEQAAASQSKVRVLSMTRRVDFSGGCECNLDWIDLADAEADGTLRAAASVYETANDMIRDDLSRPGPRVITFNNILKWDAFPLAQALDATLNRLKRAMAGDVEIEFAVDLGDWGKRLRRGEPRQLPRLVLLQARHMASQYHGESVIDLDHVGPEQLVCRSATSLGDGLLEGLRDIVWVPAQDLNGQTTPEVAREVSAINRRLLDAGRPFVLIGPGRWGTSDSALGIPVAWGDINGTRVIIETPFGTRVVDPSQGTHFFHNITSLGIGYLTVGATQSADWDTLDRDWLESQPVAWAGTWVKHLELERGVVVHLQGKKGRAAVLKPAPPDDELPRDSQPPWGNE